MEEKELVIFKKEVKTDNRIKVNNDVECNIQGLDESESLVYLMDAFIGFLMNNNYDYVDIYFLFIELFKLAIDDMAEVYFEEEELEDSKLKIEKDESPVIVKRKAFIFLWYKIITALESQDNVEAIANGLNYNEFFDLLTDKDDVEEKSIKKTKSLDDKDFDWVKKSDIKEDELNTFIKQITDNRDFAKDVFRVYLNDLMVN